MTPAAGAAEGPMTDNETTRLAPEMLRGILEAGINELGGRGRVDLARALDDLVHLAAGHDGERETTQDEPLTPDEEKALREALVHGDSWPMTQAASLVPVLLATLDHARRTHAEFHAATPPVPSREPDLGSEYGRLLAERDRLIADGEDPDDLEMPLPPEVEK